MSFDISKFAEGFGVSVSDTELREIPLDKIRENPGNFYPPLPEAEAEALRESIQANGLLEPLLVVADGGTYRLVSGHNRLRALRALNGAALGMDYKTALCRVLPPMDPARELSAIIESNRQRKKSPALLAEESRRLADAYAQRRAAGEELPGRTRDRVAADLGVSPAKLGNLSAIERGLKDTQLILWWECGMMSEAAALEAARMEPQDQDALRHWLMTEDEKPSLRNVREFYAILGMISRKCERAGGPCPNARAMYQHFCRGGNWEGCCGCCDMCLKRGTCEVCCQYAERKEPAAEPVPEPIQSPEPPEQQLVLAGWMPGGVDPGEPGLFAAVLDLDGKPVKRLLRRMGGQWLFEHVSTEINVPVLWWLRLPPVPGEEDVT